MKSDRPKSAPQSCLFPRVDVHLVVGAVAICSSNRVEHLLLPEVIFLFQQFKHSFQHEWTQIFEWSIRLTQTGKYSSGDDILQFESIEFYGYLK